MKLIGISGKKRTGKDTVADVLCGQSPKSVKWWFAQPLKVEVARACGVTVDYINNHKESFRLILQGWGTDFRRKLYDENYWIKQTDIALGQLTVPELVVIPDVRFPNEFKYLESKGAILIRVERNQLVSTDEHISETALDDYVFDYRIQNNGTLEDLIEQVKQIK